MPALDFLETFFSPPVDFENYALVSIATVYTASDRQRQRKGRRRTEKEKKKKKTLLNKWIKNKTNRHQMQNTLTLEIYFGLSDEEKMKRS